jgi:hypothetical protein
MSTALCVRLAEEIREEHAKALTAARTAVDHAVRCGQLLAEAKENVPHGEWGGWLDENFPASRRTAQGYMRLAQASETQALAHLGIEGALRELAAPKTDVEAEAPEVDGFEWVYDEIEAIIKLVQMVDSRKDMLLMLDVYMHAHHIVTSAARLMEIRAVCAIIGEVRPLIEPLPAGSDPGIQTVWIGYLDERENVVVFHPGWLDYCAEIGGEDLPIVRLLRDMDAKGGDRGELMGS